MQAVRQAVARKVLSNELAGNKPGVSEVENGYSRCDNGWGGQDNNRYGRPAQGYSTLHQQHHVVSREAFFDIALICPQSPARCSVLQ